MTRVAIIGNLALDVVAGAPERPGGAVWYCSHALQMLAPELDVTLVCRCAAEDVDRIVPLLEREVGFPIVWQPSGSTTRFSFHYEGDQRIMEIDALADPWTPADIEGWAGEAIAGADWVVVGALNRGDFPTETIAALAARGHRLMVDAQGLVRLAAVGPLVANGDVDRAIFPYLTALKLNDEEALQLCGGTDPDSLASLGIPEVVLTLGSQGAVVLSNGIASRVPAVPVDGPVDPTGAGDMFLMAYGVARLRGEEPPAAGLTASRFVSTIIAR